MQFQCKALAFAPLASDVMLAVYSNGAVAQPNMTNLRSTGPARDQRGQMDEHPR